MTAARRDNPNERRSHNRKLAERLARAGLYVFPSQDKVPLALSWQRADTAIGTDGAEEARALARKKASEQNRSFDEDTYVGSTIDVQTVKKLWRKYPDAVPSISLGPSKLYVLDADIDDSRHGPTLLKKYLADNGVDTSRCPMTESRSGGLHIFFQGGEYRSHVGPTLRAMYVQAKSLGNQVVAPGAWREDGKRYTAVAGQPSLFKAFPLCLPPLPSTLISLQAERSASADVVADDEVAAAIDAMGSDIPEIYFDPNKLVRVSDDHSTDRFALALDLARSFGDRFSPALYRSAVEAFDAAGDLVEHSPGEGEYDLRALAREFVKAKARVARESAESARLLKLDTVEDALAAVTAACAAGDTPHDEGVRLCQALDNEDAPAEQIDATRRAIDDLLSAVALGTGETFALAAIRKAATGAPTATPAKTDRGYTAESAMFDDIELTAWTIDDVLPERGVGFIVGASHTGKTFACIDMMGRLAQGGTWFDHTIYEPVCSLYISGEDVEEIPGRIKAWTMINGSTLDRLGVMNASPNIRADPKALQSIVRVVKNLKADTGLRCGLIVLDTVASLAPGLKEDSENIGILTDLMRRIGRATGAAVVGVHHPRKGEDGGDGRGSGSFYNNVTFEYRLASKKVKGGGFFQIHKNKFGKCDVVGQRFQLIPVELGVNRHGKVVSTLVFGQAAPIDMPAVELEDEAAEASVTAPVLRGQDRVFAAAKRAIERQGAPVKRSMIADELDRDGDRPMSGNTLGPLLARIVEENILVRRGRLKYGLP